MDPECFIPDPDPTHIIEAYLEIIKNTLNSIKKKNQPTICYFFYFILQSYRLQNKQSRIQRPKIINKYAISFLAGSGSGFRTNNSGSREKFRIHKTAINKCCGAGAVLGQKLGY